MGTTTTPKLGLIKPDGNEPGSNYPAQHGSNMDKLDEVLLTTTEGIRKRLATVTADADSAGITTTETTVMSITANLENGKTYAISFFGGFATTVAGDFIAVRIREDNATGTEMQSETAQIPSAGSTPFNVPLYAEYTAVATGAKTFVVTLVRQSGTGTVRRETANTRLAYLSVDYVRN